MTASWPGTLPTLLLAGYTESPPNTAIRTPMDGGVAKVRQRFTAAARPINGALLLTKAQVDTLDTFYVTTLNGGSDPFEFDNVRTGATEDFRFVSPPQYTNAGSDENWRVSMEIEQLP